MKVPDEVFLRELFREELSLKKNICILIMPTDKCNMKCVYCYHESHYDYHSYTVMDRKTLENIFKKSIPFYDHIDFLWHGGEPLLAGIDFYKDAVALQEKYSNSNCEITNKIQTNCTLLDDEMLSFLIRNGFKFGTSLDGSTNELSRGNTDKILKGIERIKHYEHSCNCILVVSSLNIEHLIECYEYFKLRKINFKFNHFIDTTHDDVSKKLSVPINEYIVAQKKLFDYWVEDRTCSIRVSTFFVYIEFFLFKRRLLEKHNSCLGKWLGIRSDGSIVQCNRYNKSYYGNINEVSTISEAFLSDGFKSMLEGAINRRNKCKLTCDVYDFCQGGCIVEAIHEGGIDTLNGFSCTETRLMYKYICDRIQQIIKDFSYFKDKINPTVSCCIEQYLCNNMEE